jgi:choline dehydrogenase-like flavoprotein
MKELVGKPPTLDDGRPGGFYLTRFRNLSERHPKFIRGYGFEGNSGCSMFPKGTDIPGFGASFKEEVRKNQGSYIGMGAFGEVLARYENYVDLDPQVKDKWGIPVLRFHYRFGQNEKLMAVDMLETAQEMFEAAGFKILRANGRIFTEGWSIHELGTVRMGSDAKSSVLNQFQQSHDVKNLFVVDGSAFVSASCHNPTWTIMALCWRSCDFLADELRKGNL